MQKFEFIEKGLGEMDSRFWCTVLAVLATTVGAAALANRAEDPLIDAPLYQQLAGVEIESPTISDASEEDTKDTPQYIIREYQGRVAVFFADNDQEPELVLDTLVQYLPDYDRSQMHEGIPVETYEQLVSRIEDYIS